MTKKHSNMTPAQVKHYQKYRRDYQQRNKIDIAKRKHNKHILLKKQIFHKYLQLGYGSGLSCQIPGCKECDIEKLGLFSTYSNSEAEIYRSIEGSDQRYQYLLKSGYPDIGAVSVCLKCYHIIRGEMRKENSKVYEAEKLMKAQIKRDERAKLLLKKEEKAKKKLENWLKDRIHSLENEIAVSQVKLDGYTGRLDQLNLTGQMIEKPEPVKVKKGLRNWLKRRVKRHRDKN